MRPLRCGSVIGVVMVGISAACGFDQAGELLSPPPDGALEGAASMLDARAVEDVVVDATPRSDGSDAADASSDRADGATVGAGMALSFDGAGDFVRVLRQVQEDFTIEAWINTMTSRNGSNFYDGLGVVYADVRGSAADFGTSILGGKFAFGTVDNTIVSTTTVTIGAWVHVAAVRVRATGTMEVLVNGVSETASNGNSTAMLTAPSTVDIGGNTIDGRYFKGKIDEVRIWNVARTAPEVLASMRTRLVGNEPGLVGYWRFDDAAGTSAVDSSPSANSGVLGNGAAAARPTWVVSDAF